MLPLLADAEVAAGASAIACLLAAINGLFSWLTRRDQLRFDGEAIRLRQRVDTLTADHARCEQQHKELREELQDLRDRIGSGHHTPLRERRKQTDPDYHGPERRIDP